MELTLAEAAQETGKGKSTLLRAVKSGKLSSRRTDEGAYMVDASELARVFPVKPVKRVTDEPMMRHDAPWSGSEAGDASRGAELAELRVKVAVQAAQLAERATLLERERETVEDLRRRLDEEQTERRALQRQITHQPTQAAETARSKGFLERLLNRLKAGI